MSEHVAYVTRIKDLRKAENSDRLQIGYCFGNPVIVSMDYTEGQLGIYFPIDLQLSAEYCAANDLVRRKDENGNPAGGYLDPNKRNIRALKLRGNRSDGLFMPLTSLAEFTTINNLKEGDRFNTLNGVEICRKYIPKIQNRDHYQHGASKPKVKVNTFPTFYEHVDTEQLAYNLNKFKPGDTIEISLKMHGTSARTGYLPEIKYNQSWLDRLFKRQGKEYHEYNYVTGTRRVVLNRDIERVGYYNSDEFRWAMADKFAGKLNKGETVYYEVVGFQGPGGAPIMSSVANSKISDKEFTKQYGKETVFSYGCDPSGGYCDYPHGEYNGTPVYVAPCCEAYVYRMTMVNEDGDVVEYSPDQMRYRCEQMGVKTVPVFERFIIPEKPRWYFEDNSEEISAGEYVLRNAEMYYGGADPVGRAHVREGVVVRRVNADKTFEVYKHKNFQFKVLEGLAKDEAVAPDMEEAQDVEGE